jgi:alcohol oxidase
MQQRTCHRGSDIRSSPADLWLNQGTHGFEGPVAISNGGWVAPIAQDFLRASNAIGIPVTDDLQDCNQSHAAEIWAKWINKDTGRRR